MKILFCGGGTAGHIGPALAIAEYIASVDKTAEIAFVGRIGGEENKPIIKQELKLYEIDICGLPRSISLKSFKSLVKIIKSRSAAKRIISDFKPDAVIGTGGYVSWPIISAAVKLNIPTLIHETNAYPGLVTRRLSPKVNRVLLNFDEAKKHLKRQDNIKISGNPVRREFYETERKAARRELHLTDADFFIVSFGGSGGSERLNEVIGEFINEYSSRDKKIKHLHASGTRYYDSFKEILEKGKSANITIKRYIDNMPVLLAASDLVISRSGAMTLSELSAAGCASVLIPSPNVTNNHQFLNADYFRKKGAAILIEENELSPERLISEVEELRKSKKQRYLLKEKIRKDFKKNTVEIIFNEIKAELYSALY